MAAYSEDLNLVSFVDKHIIELINTKMNDQIVTIGVGDNQNDIEMLRHTDYACLVKNDNFDSSLINIENLSQITL